EVSYRDVVGFVDLIMDFPIEIKSTTNRSFKYIQKEGAKRGHKLQAELYAKAKGFDKYGICYVASDDYRTLTFIYDVTSEVDDVIDQYEQQVAKGTIPTFESKEDWQAMKDYNPYYEWQGLTEQ